MNRLPRLMVISLVALIVLSAVGIAGAAHNGPSGAYLNQSGGRTPAEICADATQDLPEPDTRSFDQAEDVLQDGVDYGVVLCTAQGAAYFDLFEADAPVTVNNFVFLAQQYYFNNTTFHRVIPGFMAQAGDPTGTGSGGPGYQFEDETDNGLTFDSGGLLAMANAGENTNGSQFFVTYSATSWLDGNHTIFGEIVQGIDVMESITPRDPEQTPDVAGDALQTVVIIDDPASVSVTADGAPSLDHFQLLLNNNIVSQISGLFVLVDEFSHTYDADAEAESWRGDGGDDLVAYMQGYLADHGFEGTAAVLLKVSECPEVPEENPIWLVGFQVSDYSTAGEGDVVAADDARSDMLVSSGAYEAYQDVADFGGRVYSQPAEDVCGPSGVYYRYELSQGRYVLTVDAVLDNDIIGSDTEPTAEQLLIYLMNELMIPSILGPVERGNLAVAAE
ncbi:MAG: peptidylprolyl isomerase [Anaerolineae bacterium]|nr:peptidylprolyl isomerase [Anaerolineae bacterium]